MARSSCIAGGARVGLLRGTDRSVVLSQWPAITLARVGPRPQGWGLPTSPRRAKRRQGRVTLAPRGGSDHRPQPWAARSRRSDRDQGAGSVVGGILQTGTRSALAGALVVALTSSPLRAQDLEIRYPSSPQPEIAAIQRSLVQMWGYTTQVYVDPTFNGLGPEEWTLALKKSLTDTFRAPDLDSARACMQRLLDLLGDPFTRVLAPEVGQSYMRQERGETVGVGIQVSQASKPGNGGGYIIVGVVSDTPASRSGIKVGDELVAIGGTDLTGVSIDDLPAVLNGPSGSEAALRLRRAPPEGSTWMAAARGGEYRVVLKREAIPVKAVQYAALKARPAEGIKGGGGAGGPGEKTESEVVGYVRVLQFTEASGFEAREAVEDLVEGSGAGRILLDLRDNPGGNVGAAVQIAHLFLRDEDIFCYVVDRAGVPRAFRVMDGYGELDGGQSLQGDRGPVTSLPVEVLLNGGSASSSELLAGALRDNGRATLVGEKSFGKGRTQTVYGDLADGSLLLVTTALYETPKHVKVDGVGLEPDVACKPEVVVGGAWVGGESDGGEVSGDPCVLAAERAWGLEPLDP